MKTRKSITKRFKITKNGKILRRATGQDHNRSKKSGDQLRKSKKWVLVDKTLSKKIRKALVI
jgi:large subunit ribosomal protein L35